ncbi:hypothetical protein [Bacillus sp. SM2101]|uniref:hypothetical protein n=1 Tax=Bacillus sp. SM2101 TaxID=2805366 RepID=UPI001BDEA219|nr:hypothetical protein [Bacillus sp. SM2101]
MSDCQCKGKENNEIFCNCQFEEFTLNDGMEGSVFVPIILTTDTISVTEKDWVAKIDTMVDLQANVNGPEAFGVLYVVERITGGNAITLCSYPVSDERQDIFTLTPSYTICDTPPIGCHTYRLSILDNKCEPAFLILTSTCRCINVSTFQNGK